MSASKHARRVVAICCLLLPAVAIADDITVLIAYSSKSMRTEAMAQAVAEGARAVDGTTVVLSRVEAVEESVLLAADAIIVGSPVYNANVAPEVQSFINAWPFRGAPLRDKIGAAFVTAGAISAGEETTQLSILRSMLVFGMVVVGGDGWRSAFGASAITEEEPLVSEPGEIAEMFEDKGRKLGARVAELTLRFAGRRSLDQAKSIERASGESDGGR